MFTYHVYSCALHIKRVKFYFAPHELIFILLGDIAPVKNVHSISSIISNKIMCVFISDLEQCTGVCGGMSTVVEVVFCYLWVSPKWKCSYVRAIKLIPRRKWGQVHDSHLPGLSLSLYIYKIKSTYLAKNNGKELNRGIISDSGILAPLTVNLLCKILNDRYQPRVL